MQINWQEVAASPGYQSLKESYIRDITVSKKRVGRSKDELYKHFQWVINRAKHYAHHTGRTVGEILTDWESKRDYWWLNYYQESRQPKFHSGSKKPMGLNGLRKYYRKNRWNIKLRKHRIMEFIAFQQKQTSTRGDKPKRWNMARKRRVNEVRKLVARRETV